MKISVISQRRRDGAGMLGPGASERGQNVLLDIESPHNRNFPDRTRHGLVGNPYEPQCHFFHGHAGNAFFFAVRVDLLRQASERLSARIGIQGEVVGFAEDFGKIFRPYSSQDQGWRR